MLMDKKHAEMWVDDALLI